VGPQFKRLVNKQLHSFVAAFLFGSDLLALKLAINVSANYVELTELGYQIKYLYCVNKIGRRMHEFKMAFWWCLIIAICC
jgi:hypothetical protein